MRQIEELKEGTAKKEAELVEIKKAQAVNVSVRNWKFPCHVLINHRLIGTQGLFTWSEGPRSSGVGFFCFHALEDPKQKKPTRPWSPTSCKQGQNCGPVFHRLMCRKVAKCSVK